MKSKYGRIAIDAVKVIQENPIIHPLDAWYIASEMYFQPGSWGWKKSCPKDTFLGICEEGYLKGVSPGKYTNSKANKTYGIKALILLKANPSLINSKNKLWSKVVGKNYITHNNQLDVVIALLEEKLICFS